MDCFKLTCVIFVLFVGHLKGALSARNCYERYISGDTTDDYYYIDADGGGPLAQFMVWCDMVNQGVTHVRHDRMVLATVQGATDALHSPLTYENSVSLAQMVALIESSGSCKQQLRYDCENSRLFRASDDVAITWWIDRNNAAKFNWGTETNVQGCKCRVDGNCLGGVSARCNCDSEGTGLQSDVGYLTDSDLLPVTGIHVGLEEVNDAGEVGKYLVSSLQCQGSEKNLYPSCSALKEAGLLTVNGEYLIDPDGIDIGLRPFLVRCDTEGKTEVVHNNPGTNQIPVNTGDPGFYAIDLTYDSNVSNEQLALLVETSEACWQWLSMKCRSVRIFDGTTPVSWWIANDGNSQLNWAAPQGVEGCGCSQEFAIATTGLTATQSYTAMSMNPAGYAIDTTSTTTGTGAAAVTTVTPTTATCQVAPQDPANLAAPRWWGIDLGQSYCIGHLKITNTATNNQLLTGAYVTVGDDATYAPNQRCREPLASGEVSAPSGVVPVYCKQQVCGRYLAVIHPTQVLSMCHVAIYAFQIFPHKPIDLVGLTATQSTVLQDGKPELAIDGNANGNFMTGMSCIVTEAADDVSQWWAAEFKQYQCVSRVVIKNREECCYNRLEGAVVRVGSNAMYGMNPQCGATVTQAQATAAGAEIEFLCDPPLCGTHLVVQQKEGEYLTLCEVWAWESIPHDTAVPLQGLSVSQSSMMVGGDGLNAIDGNDNPVFAGGSCSSTAEGQNENAWWSVDLGELKSECINRVVIKNRGDAQYDRLAGAIVRVGNSMTYGDNPQCGIAVRDEQATTGATVTVWCQPTTRCGRFISIHQSVGDRVLTLCEVWAFATLPDPPMIGSCEANNKCNCDANDATLRYDAGYIREQSALPVQEVRIGDVVNAVDDSAAVEVGPLQCEGADVPVLRSCQEIYASGYDFSGQYLIDPDGANVGHAPFLVYCDMTQDRGRTCIGHNQEEPRWVPEDSDQSGEYRRDLTYDGASLAQVIALIDASVYCQQWVRLDCYNYEIYVAGNSNTWWMDRTMTKRDNWGSPMTTMGCECSVTNTCTNSQPRCNCDVNAAAWNFDEGYVKDKAWLPITVVRTGGTTTSAEKARIHVGKLTCWGLDECTANLHRCHPLATCTDTADSYTCACNAGYVGDGRECADVDECAGTNNCAVGQSKCTNTEGSFICECLPGYTGDGVQCFDIQECVAATAECHANAMCVNMAGTYGCVCNTGFIGNGKDNCDDINECSMNTDMCDNTAVCQNTAGGHTCLCPPGYSGSGTTGNPCVDIDECALNTDDCGLNGYCVNTRGTYGCQCNPGYTGNGKTCVDINECADNLDNCDQYAACANTEGAFTCTCLSNFRGDGRTCVDINECGESRDDCSNFADCINTNGGFGCQCMAGYVGNGRTCTGPTDAPPLLSTSAIIGISLGAAGILALLLGVCCCCCIFMNRASTAPVAPPIGLVPQPYLEPPRQQFQRGPPPQFLQGGQDPRIRYGPPPVGY